MTISRENAWELVNEYTSNRNLIQHMLAAEACLKAYAQKFNQDESLWSITGLIHDFDYERYPADHPQKGLDILKEVKYPPEILEAIAGHVKDGERKTLLAKTLYAVDELAGFIIACSLVRPEGLNGMTAKSVKKKLKDKSFAAAVNREEIKKSAEDLGLNFDAHIDLCIEAITKTKAITKTNRTGL